MPVSTNPEANCPAINPPITDQLPPEGPYPENMTALKLKIVKDLREEVEDIINVFKGLDAGDEEVMDREFYKYPDNIPLQKTDALHYLFLPLENILSEAICCGFFQPRQADNVIDIDYANREKNSLKDLLGFIDRLSDLTFPIVIKAAADNNFEGLLTRFDAVTNGLCI